MFLMALACCWVASDYFTIISYYLTESAMLLKENDVPIVKWACFLIGKFLQLFETPHQMLFFFSSSVAKEIDATKKLENSIEIKSKM